MTTPFSLSSFNFTTPAGINSIDALIFDTKWASSTISYSFPSINTSLFWSTNSAIGYGPQIGSGEPWDKAFGSLSDANKTGFVQALTRWGNVANLNFELVEEETPNAVGDIRVAFTDHINDSFVSWAYLPGGGNQAGDIWINDRNFLDSQAWEPGNTAFQAILHEIGHALGLMHPFSESPTDTTTLPEIQDSLIHTVMSYSYRDVAGVTGLDYSYHPTTPMVLDIAAIQYLYGANNDYHANDDVYAFDDTTTYHETIWDAGGSDTIQYTGAVATTIDLNPAAASYIGNAVYMLTADVNTNLPIPNVWIAEGAMIENVIGGQGNDLLIGNDSSNVLDGGAGIDTVQLAERQSAYHLSQSSDGFAITTNTRLANEDKLVNIERLQFEDSNLALDLVGHAGQTAKLLGAVFGASSINNAEFVGIGIAELDNGMSYEQLGELAFNVTGLTNHDEIVTLLWQNLFGAVPSEEERTPYIELLDDGISVGALTVIAADSSFNAENIDLVGLAETGIVFI